MPRFKFDTIESAIEDIRDGRDRDRRATTRTARTRATWRDRRREGHPGGREPHGAGTAAAWSAYAHHARSAADDLEPAADGARQHLPNRRRPPSPSPIDLREGNITTGISAADRAATIQGTAIQPGDPPRRPAPPSGPRLPAHCAPRAAACCGASGADRGRGRPGVKLAGYSTPPR
jgi:hypothetical protein